MVDAHKVQFDRTDVRSTVGVLKEELRQRASLSTIPGQVEGMLHYQLDSFVYTHHVETQVATTSVTLPATWLDWVKDRFAPKWLLRRWPIQYRTYKDTHKFHVKRYYPDWPGPQALEGEKYITLTFLEKMPQS